jgi:hypothetical protein
LTKAAAVEPNRADVWYEKAWYECVDGFIDEALRSLEKAYELDGAYADFAGKVDSDFRALRADPRFREIITKRHEQLRKTIPEVDTPLLVVASALKGVQFCY